MATEATDKKGPERTGIFPACCKDIAEKMAECGPMMEEMLSRFGAKAEDGGCCGRDERRENP